MRRTSILALTLSLGMAAGGTANAGSYRALSTASARANTKHAFKQVGEVVAGAGAIVVLGGLLAIVPSASPAASSTESALSSQTQQMDGLTTSRGEGVVSSRISSDFSSFAGSTANSDALVSGLRNGAPITLTSTDAKGATTSTTFTPPTGKMGYGNVYISMSLAKQQLAAAGITEPTAQQLEAALMGGTVTNSSGQTTTMTGVLQLRADGMGWGQIQQELGLLPGGPPSTPPGNGNGQPGGGPPSTPPGNGNGPPGGWPPGGGPPATPPGQGNGPPGGGPPGGKPDK